MDTDILKDIPDGKPVRIFLPLKDSKERFRSQCVLQKSSYPEVSLLFKVGDLPKELLDTNTPCIINIDMGGPNVSLEAIIEEVLETNALRMIGQKSINHEQLREFFRVDAGTEVISKAFHPRVFNHNEEDWSLNGRTIDISGSGLLASFESNPPMDKQVRLEVSIPNEEKDIISILATPIRSIKISDNQYDVAYHFDQIEPEDQDLIIGYCLVLQRKLLRMKV